MPDNRRREFLRLAAAASLAGANPRFLQAAGGTRMQGWVTSQDRKLEEVKLGEWRTFSSDNTNGVVIDATKRYQEVLGFGAAFTDASCYVLADGTRKATGAPRRSVCSKRIATVGRANMHRLQRLLAVRVQL
jgi:hypothetical protein